MCSLCELGPASVKADLKNGSHQAACRLREEERREKEGRERERQREKVEEEGMNEVVEEENEWNREEG